VEQAFQERTPLLPSQRLAAEELIELMRADLQAIRQVADAYERRIVQDEKVPSSEKIISLSEDDAAFIVKGGWATVIGYRPQVGKSGRGFVSALIVPLGNAADNAQLVDVVVDHWERSGVLPQLVSCDDGYSDRSARQDLLDTGISTVSISGAKGKRMTSEQDWKRPTYRAARANRSGIEALVFTLKHGSSLGNCSGACMRMCEPS
jgi:hypothetical protein